MNVRELVNKYEGLCYCSGLPGSGMELTIIDNPEVRSVLDSLALDSRAFVCRKQGNILVGRKCLTVRVPADVWYGDAASTYKDEIDRLKADVTALKADVARLWKR